MNYTLILDTLIIGNTVKSWLIFLGFILAGTMVLRLLKNTIFRYLKRWADSTATNIDNLLLEITEKNVYPYLYYLVFLAAARYLDLPARVLIIVDGIGKILLTIFVTRSVLQILRHIFETKLLKTSEGNHYRKELSGLFRIVSFIIWSIGALLLLDNLGIKITTLVAGMGIGGVAVALAAQAILGDLFAYFSILFDKPFEIGDFIITGDYMGTIEHIGIKTTRIRSLGGEQIIFSNSDLIGSRPRNYKRMSRRRVVFKIGVTYDTPKDKMERLPVLIKEIITSLPLTTFDRAHFSGFGDSSLDIETVYYVEDADYNKYMDIQQAINLSIMEFSKLGVEFAFPSRTIYLKK